MGRISDEDIQRVRDATDLVQLVSETMVLKQKGRLFWGNCPFHQERTPSFKVDPATQLWHCFGCGAGGDVFGFAMQSQGLEFPDAVRWLAERARIEITEEGGSSTPSGTKERLRAACEAAAAFYHRVLTKDLSAEAQAAREYLRSRGFGSDVAKRWRLGYAPRNGTALVAELSKAGFSHEELVGANLAFEGRAGGLRDRFLGRVIFPINDLHGRVIAFGGRVVGAGESDAPKYLNSNETPIFVKANNLYGLDKARNAIVMDGVAVVVEGYTDVIALHEAGIGSAVATLGTALGDRHIRLLGRFAKRIVYMFDGDEAGLRAADRAVEFLDWTATPEAGRLQVDVAVAVIPGGEDPADFVSTHGVDAMRALIGDAEPLLRFAIERRLARHDLGTPEGKSAALGEAIQVLAPVRGSIIAEEYVRYIAHRLLVDPAAVQRALSTVKTPSTQAAYPTDEVGEAKPAAREALSPAEALLLQIVANHPRFREAARELLADESGEKPLSPSGELLLRAIVTSGDAVGSALVDAVREQDRSLAQLLSGSLVDCPDVEEVEYAFREVARRLKESALERLILRKKAEMRALNRSRDGSKQDSLFREIVELQRKRAALAADEGREETTE